MFPLSPALVFDVAVVGTGIAGQAAALGCVQRGLKTVLVGPPPAAPGAPAARAEAPFDARIYAIAPGSVELLQQLRVWERVDAARVCPVERMRVFGDRGDELRFDAYAAGVERLATIVEESVFLRTLQTANEWATGLAREPHALARLDASAPAAVRLMLDDGRTLDAKLVVGADGANSSVRAACGVNADTFDYRQQGVVANFACERPHDNTAWQWFTDEGVLALLPLPGAYVSMVWSAPNDLAAQLLALDGDALAARVQRRCGGVLGALQPAGGALGFPLRRLDVDRLVVPRVALVGDAAHVVHPLAGQGLNLGLLDVSELLRVLAGREPFRDVGDPVLLRRYARRRAEPIGLMRFTTDGLARLFAIDDPLVSRVRSAGIGLVNRIGPLRDALVRRALG
jgi:ubiquinone biosynthesis UbiH/UbiF/VisC/COQ6 family hydroxylase